MWLHLSSWYLGTFLFLFPHILIAVSFEFRFLKIQRSDKIDNISNVLNSQNSIMMLKI